MQYVSKQGTIVHLRVGVGEGAGWGPPDDFLGTPVVVMLFGDDGYYGIDLRPGVDLPANLAMLATLQDAFRRGLTVGLLCKVEDGKKAGRIVHVDVERAITAAQPDMVATVGASR